MEKLEKLHYIGEREAHLLDDSVPQAGTPEKQSHQFNI